MIEYLCDGRVNVVETINGANILTLKRTEKNIESGESLGRDKKHIHCNENDLDAKH